MMSSRDEDFFEATAEAGRETLKADLRRISNSSDPEDPEDEIIAGKS
jgi:hypothetical protein